MSATRSISNRPAERSREARLGLVMYGGISLAIYIYGVAREFFDALRGRGIFKLLKALTDSDIVVDVISGTSAGGINGILLAYCMANELEFGNAGSTWREHGGIASLLRDPVHDQNPPSVLRGDDYFLPELIKTFAELTTVPAANSAVAGGEEPSHLQEMDVFITSTDVDGRIETRFDALGHPIDVKNHRVVFQMKHRAGRKEPFKPTDPALFDALGKLARATSSFPAAFEPVQIQPPDWTPLPPAIATERPPADDRLLLWGWGPQGSERNVFLVDGGVLDNKPFSVTIREIFNRLAERQVVRKLFYVEPDPERFRRPHGVPPPGLLRVVWDSLSTIPGYQSIAADLDELDNHNERVRHFNELVDHYRDLHPIPLDDDTRAFIERVRSWEHGKTGPAEDVDGRSTGRPSPYASCRLAALSARVVTGVLRVDGRTVQLTDGERRAAAVLQAAFDRWPGSGDFTLYNFDVQFRLRRLFHVLYACPDPSPSQTPEENQRRRRARYALNRQVKLLDMIRNAIERLLDEGAFHWQPMDPEIQQVIARISEDEATLKPGAGLPTATDALPAEDQGKIATWADRLWHDEVAAAFLYLLDVGKKADPLLPDRYFPESARELDQGWLDRAQLNDIAERLWSETSGGPPIKEGLEPPPLSRLVRAKMFLKQGDIVRLRPSPEDFTSLLVRTDECERRILALIGDVRSKSLTDRSISDTTLAQEYDRFIEIDAQMCPLMTVCGLGERDVIDTVRISPLDAQSGFSRQQLADKVAGDALHHFGGFFKQSWRSNDILWGRLDAVCQLIETLLTPERVECVLQDQDVVGQLVQIKAATLFPQSPQQTVDAIDAWITAMATGSPAQRAAALHKTRFAEMRGLLIEAQQLEILHEEVPKVIEDAIEEQLNWNQLRVLPKHVESPTDIFGFDPRCDGFFTAGSGTRDELVSTAAAAALAQQTAQRIRGNGARPTGTRPTDTPLGDFFLRKYRVGSESLTKDVPVVVLLNILSTALLVVRNCLVATFANPAAVRRTALYRFVSLVLWSFDGFVGTLKTGVSSALALMIGLLLIAILALVVGINWWHAIISSEAGFYLRWFVVFILVPLGIVFGELWVLRQLALHRRLSGADPLHTRNPLSWIPPAYTRIALIVLFVAVVGGAVLQGYASGWWWGVQRLLIDHPDRIATLKEAELAQVWAGLCVDYAWIVAYASFLSLAALALTRRLCAAASVLWPIGIALAWLAWIAGAVDMIENTVLAWLLATNGPLETGCLGELQRYVVPIGRFCSHQKFTLPIVIVIVLLVGEWIARRRRT